MEIIGPFAQADGPHHTAQELGLLLVAASGPDVRQHGIDAHTVTFALLAVARVNGNGLPGDLLGFLVLASLVQEQRLPNQRALLELIASEHCIQPRNGLLPRELDQQLIRAIIPTRLLEHGFADVWSQGFALLHRLRQIASRYLRKNLALKRNMDIGFRT